MNPTPSLDVRLLDPREVQPNPDNPRRWFDPERLDELAASMRPIGHNTTPALVRPTPPGRGPVLFQGQPVQGAYELVMGERRWQACLRAGLPFLTMVRELTDQEALEQMNVENLQREDITAIEEANGFRALIDRCGYTPDTLAEKIGKSRSHVFARLRLLRLHPKVLEALKKGDVEASVADLLAKFPEALQPEVLEEVLPDEWNRLAGPRSFRDAKSRVDGFWPSLSAAPWPHKDADLVPAAGACKDCPKRSGNMPDMEGLTKGPNVCTDRRCYQGKVDAWREKRLGELQAKGSPVLDPGKHREVFGEGDEDRPAYDSGFKLASDTCYEAGGGKSWEALVKKLDVPLLTAIAPNGEEVRLVDEKAARGALVAAGVLQPRGGRLASKEERRSVIEENRAKRATTEALAEAVSAAAAARPAAEFWATYCHVYAPYNGQKLLQARYGGEALERMRQEILGELQSLALALQFAGSQGSLNDWEVAKWAKLLDVDVKAVARQAKTQRNAQAKPAKAAAKAKKKR